MTPLVAKMQLDPSTIDTRGASRRTLRLDLPAASSNDEIRVLIHNLSESGLMIETTARFEVGDSFQVDLPEAGLTEARVIWSRDSFCGCEFVRPVSKGAVSAALLRTPIDRAAPANDQAEPVTWHRYDDAWIQQQRRTPQQNAALVALTTLLGLAVIFLAALLVMPISASQFGF